MTKNEKKVLAEMVSEMKHGTGATYETYSVGENILSAFPCIKEEYENNKEVAMKDSIELDIIHVLFSHVNEGLIRGGRFEESNRLRDITFNYVWEILYDYLEEKDLTGVELSEELPDRLTERNRALKKILTSDTWKALSEEYTKLHVKEEDAHNVVEYLTLQLDEYELIKE